MAENTFTEGLHDVQQEVAEFFLVEPLRALVEMFGGSSSSNSSGGGSSRESQSGGGCRCPGRCCCH
jgi:hypothetical protein